MPRAEVAQGPAVSRKCQCCWVTPNEEDARYRSCRGRLVCLALKMAPPRKTTHRSSSGARPVCCSSLQAALLFLDSFCVEAALSQAFMVVEMATLGGHTHT